MVYLIVFVEKARALRQVGFFKNNPFVTINFLGETSRSGVEEDGTNPGRCATLQFRCCSIAVVGCTRADE